MERLVQRNKNVKENGWKGWKKKAYLKKGAIQS